jgi:hypothetical protein
VARKYLLNPGSKTLHIQDGCDYAKNNIANYLIFSSEEAVSEHTKGKHKWCKNCYKKKDSLSEKVSVELVETDLTNYTIDLPKKEKYQKFENFFFKLSLVTVAVSILFAFLVSVLWGLIIGVVSFFAFSLVGGYLDDDVNWAKSDDARKQAIKKGKLYSALSVFIVGAVFLFAMMLSSIDLFGSSSNQFDDVFNKDPNTWTDEEKDYVNDFFDWLDKQD